MALIQRVADWRRRPGDLAPVRRPDRILLADPAAFEVAEAINPHMRDPSGGVWAVDRAEARRQWEALREAYVGAGLEVAVLPPAPGLADLCFTANPSLFLPLPDGGLECWLARMAHGSRSGEVAHHRRFAEFRGIPVREMPAAVQRFEGCGDGIHHPGRFLLHCGIGPRTEPGAWEALAAAHPDLELLLYRLPDERFYHLDTALAALTEAAALVAPAAFDPEGLELVRAAFPEAIDVPLEEALRFAANAHCPDGRHVLIQSGCPRTEAALAERGFQVVSLETGEFRKSGGSVFCLKQVY